MKVVITIQESLIAPEAVRPPSDNNRATGTTNAMTTQEVAHAVQQTPTKHVLYGGNNGHKWTEVKKKKKNMCWANGCGSACVQGHHLLLEI